ncbi:MAG: hypothetical protein AAGM22_19750 [Acidobacteriota bacterium]
MRDLTFVKLGGSLITDKRRRAHARRAVIRDLAEQLGRVLNRRSELDGRSPGILLGHGSGSFGHTAAIEHGFVDGPAVTPQAAAEVARAASRLNGLVVDALLAAGVPAWSWAPSGVIKARDGRLRGGGVGSLVEALDAGLVPVVYGDVVIDVPGLAAIASTEAVVSYLRPRLRRRGYGLRELVWLGETAGIWNSDGHVIESVNASNYRRVRRAVGGSAGADVTGGMLLRLDTAWRLAQHGVGSLIADGRQPGLLEAALGAVHAPVPGTRVQPPSA